MKKIDKENLSRCAREVRDLADLLLAKLEYIEMKLAAPEELDAALDGLAKRGAITPEQADGAKRRISAGGEA